MRVLVSGSRDWTDYYPIQDHLARLPRNSVVMHGGARGVDQLADVAARALGLEVEVFPADWTRHGKGAGILRNLQMLDRKPDLILAFQLDGSRGTQHVIDEAHRRGIPISGLVRFTKTLTTDTKEAPDSA